MTVESINFNDPGLIIEIKYQHMLEKKNYSNGQKVYELTGDKLTYFLKTGKIKASGPYINGKMKGEWLFYRETGQLCVVGNFKNNIKTVRRSVMIKMAVLNFRNSLKTTN